MTEHSVCLWVKAEPFSYGAFPIAPHPRLTFSNIKKIVIYAKNKGNLGFPRINYSVWRHIACNKLHLTEDLAWMYFSTCHTFCEDLSAMERIERDQEMADCSSQTERDRLRSSVNMSTLRFVLYLYIQQIYKVSLKASLVSGEEWPTVRSSSPDLDGTGRSTPRGNKTLDDHSHMVFVQNHIHEILELLVEPDVLSSVGPGDLAVSLVALEALGFLLTGSVDKCKSLLPIQDIALLQTVQHRTGYSKMTRIFSLRLLQTWIKDSLMPNPFGISSCIASGRRLSWPMAGNDLLPQIYSCIASGCCPTQTTNRKSSIPQIYSSTGEDKDNKSDQATKRGKIATNAHAVPKGHVKGSKIIIMSQVSKQTISRRSGTLENSSVKIHRCHYSYLYLLSPLRSVTIEKCRNSTIILGPVETTVYLSHCEKVTLIAPCRFLMISGSTLCNLHLMTPSRPMLLGGNDTILLAPYHTHYPSLGDQLTAAGLCAQRNLWNQPLCVGPEHKDETPVWELLPVQEFFTFNIPFHMEGSTTDIPGGLPTKYQKAVTQRQKMIDSWQKTVKEAGLTREQRKEFQALVETRFHVWLAETGYKRELDSLVAPLQSGAKK